MQRKSPLAASSVSICLSGCIRATITWRIFTTVFLDYLTLKDGTDMLPETPVNKLTTNIRFVPSQNSEGLDHIVEEA